MSPMGRDKNTHPALHIVISHGNGCENPFFAINGFFGRSRPTTEDPFLDEIQPDKAGWKGESDLIVICAVPLLTFMVGNTRDVQVALHINPSPSNLEQYSSLFGNELRVYRTSLRSNRVRLLNQPPGFT